VNYRTCPVLGGQYNLIDGNPVDAGGFHRHGLNLARFQPVSQSVEIDGEGGKDLHRLFIPVGRDTSIDLFSTDIETSGVKIDLSHDIQRRYTHRGLLTLCHALHLLYS
jgi:hypothetical protein